MISFNVSFSKFRASILTLLLFLVVILNRRSGKVIESYCMWPPKRPSDMSADIQLNITLCVHPVDHLTEQSEPSYEFSKLFHLTENFSGQRVTFDDLANLPDEILERASYPEIFSTYPQNVPLQEIVDRIKKGQSVFHVRGLFFYLFSLGKIVFLLYKGNNQKGIS